MAIQNGKQTESPKLSRTEQFGHAHSEIAHFSQQATKLISQHPPEENQDFWNAYLQGINNFLSFLEDQVLQPKAGEDSSRDGQ